jgi:D-aspartate ligase
VSAYLQLERRALDRARLPVMLLGGINIVRALGLAGIPAIVASSAPYTPAMSSRYAIGRCTLPPLAQREAVVARLLRVGEELTQALGTRAPLFYGDDDYLGIVQDFRTALAARYVFLVNDPPLARALHSKALFQALGERRGLPLPQRLDWESLETFDAPVLVKPRMKTHWASSGLQAKLFGGAGKARIFSSGRAAKQNAQVVRLREALAFQEYVPGDDRSLWSFHGFADERSELLASFIGRKIRTYPVLTGDSSYLELAHDEELERLGSEIVTKLRLKGPFKIDFKRHESSGRFYLLEINARYNLWHYLGAKNGVNLAAVAYAYLTCGERPEPMRARATYRWVAMDLDYRAFRESDLRWLAWLRSLLAAPKVYDLFSWRDPLPAVLGLREFATTAAPRITRRVRRWLSTAS